VSHLLPPPPTFGARALSLLTWLALASFVVFLVAQHALVFPYHDDWGVAVLDYVGEQSGFVGQHFKLHHVLGFLQGMYENWSGRVVAFFLQIYLFKFGLWYVRAFQVLSIVAISFLAVKVAQPGRFGQPLALLPIVLYLALPQVVLLGGLYWFSASSAYLWGIGPFALAAYLLVRSQKVSLLPSVLLAISSTFHEQMGVAVVVFATSYLVLSHLRDPQRQRLSTKLCYLAATPILALLTILAPGNFNRKSLSQYPAGSLLDHVIANGRAASTILVSNGSTFFAVLVLSLVCLLASRDRFDTWSRKELVATGVGGLALITAYFLSMPVLAVSVFMLMFGTALYRACKAYDGGTVVFSMFLGALASLLPLLLAPGVPGRSFLIFYFLTFTPIVFSFARATRGALQVAIAFALCPILALGLVSARDVFRGYRSNQEIHLVNHYRLVTASFEIRTGSPPRRSILLNRIPSPTYAETMAYERPLIEKWMKKYYSLPTEVDFVWQ
jgi:hypothetical protein